MEFLKRTVVPGALLIFALLSSNVAVVDAVLPGSAQSQYSSTGPIILDFSAERLDDRIEMSNRLSGVTRYFVKSGVNGTIKILQIYGNQLKLGDQNRKVDAVLCTSPFNNQCTVQFSDNTSRDYLLSSEGITERNPNDEGDQDHYDDDDIARGLLQHTLNANAEDQNDAIVQVYNNEASAESSNHEEKYSPEKTSKDLQKEDEAAEAKKAPTGTKGVSDTLGRRLKRKAPRSPADVAGHGQDDTKGDSNLRSDSSADHLKGDDKAGGSQDTLAGRIHDSKLASSKTDVTSGEEADAKLKEAKEERFKATVEDEKNPFLSSFEADKKPKESAPGHNLRNKNAEIGGADSHGAAGPYESLRRETKPGIERLNAGFQRQPVPGSTPVAPLIDNRLLNNSINKSETVPGDSPKQITFIYGGDNPEIVEDYAGEVPCYKARSGHIITSIVIDGKKRAVGGYTPIQTIVCVVKEGNKYNIVVGTLNNKAWTATYLSKTGDQDILRDVSIKDKFTGVNYQMLMHKVFTDSSLPRHATSIPNFIFNGRGNASLKQLKPNSPIYILETVENGYEKKKKQDITFIEGPFRTPENMKVTHMASGTIENQTYLIITFRGENVLYHRKYVEGPSPGTYRKGSYDVAADYDMSRTLSSYGLRSIAIFNILDTQQMETSAILADIPIEKFGDISFINIGEPFVDTLVLNGDYEILLKANERHTITVHDNGNGCSMQITSIGENTIKRVSITPDQDERNAYVVNFS